MMSLPLFQSAVPALRPGSALTSTAKIRKRPSKRWALLAWSVVSLGLTCSTQAAVTLATNTLISATDTTYDGSDLVVSNCTVTMAGTHAFRSLSLVNQAVVTHPPCTASEVQGLRLSITAGLAIDSSSRIDASGRGYLPGRTQGNSTEGAATGRAGGSYGGIGGPGYFDGSAGGVVYGDYRNPSEPGAGSGYVAPGGGFIWITAGSISLDGAIRADGVGAGFNTPGGSGGGIRLQTGTLTGVGSISVNGGVGDYDGGSGSGGRVAVYYASADRFDLSKVTSYAGYVSRAGQGGCGTVYLKAGSAEGVLRLSNGGFTEKKAYTPLGLPADSAFVAETLQIAGTNLVVYPEHQLPLQMRRLQIQQGGVLTHLANQGSNVHSLLLTVTNDLVIGLSAAIDVSGKGYTGGWTFGDSNTNGPGERAGGSYGGLGGASYYGSTPNDVYGDYRNPNELGTGAAPGGSGGGLLRLSAGSVQLDGGIFANGFGAGFNTGGGSGGAIRMDVQTISGQGWVSANGGQGDYDGGAGSGGRVAIYYDNAASFNLANVTAYGGSANRSSFGAAGTVFTQKKSSLGMLRVDNGAWAGGTVVTPLGVGSDSEFRADNLVLAGANVQVRPHHQMPVLLQNLWITNGAILTHLRTTTQSEYRLLVNVAGAVLVDTNSAINVSGRGYVPGRTEGNRPLEEASSRVGGSYGGLGGRAYFGGFVPPVYGDYHDPNSPGTGALIGGPGGGVVRITADSLQLDGLLKADGVGAGFNTAGGSGGAIRLDVRALSGLGSISAQGGFGDYDGGSGSGGRIAIFYATSQGFDFARVTAYAGDAPRASMGGPGTFYLKQTGAEGVLRLDNGNLAGKTGYTPLGISSDQAFEAETLVISGTNLIVLPEHQMPVRANRLSLLSGAVLKHYETTVSNEFSLLVTVTNEFTIGSGSRVDVTGCGYLSGYTVGNTVAGAATDRAGGSYGGFGGRGYVGGTANRVYGDYRDPNQLGSGASLGSSGGGLARIVAKTLRLDGAILADSINRTFDHAGGSGGGIRLDVETLGGEGLITANGADGNYNGGGGGGGRIAIYASLANTFPVDNIRVYGGQQVRSGQGGAGTIYLKTGNQPGELRVGNGGSTEAVGIVYLGTAGDSVFRADRLTISGTNLWVMTEHQMPIEVGELSVLNGAVLTHAPATEETTSFLDIRVANTFRLDVSSRVDVNARGYLPGRTLGNQVVGAASVSAGGSYGGLGGRGYHSGTPNRVYGDYRNPNEHGTGGSYGGAGGGLVRISASTIDLDGIITANGSYAGFNTPGGSGGGVCLQAGTLRGQGIIRANGATGDYDGGAGGGGRIAVYYDIDEGFAWTNATAYGGYAQRSSLGGAGTVFFQQTGREGFLLVENRSELNKRGITPLGLPEMDRFQADTVVISGTNTTVIPEHPMMLNMHNLSVVNGALITHPPATTEAEYYLALSVKTNFLLDAASTILADGLGYLPGRTAGNLTEGAATANSGGSHGGLGGLGYYGGTPNGLYDELRAPTFPGAGAGNGGRGGGVVRLSAGQAQLEGVISANGVGAGFNTSGGAGGSLLINALSLAGNGILRADGGPGDYDGGGGGGGRVAIYAAANTLTATNVTANGGPAGRSQPGATGTVYYATAPFFVLNEPQADSVVHGVTALRWNALGLGGADLVAELTASRNGLANTISLPQDAQGDALWDTTLLPDGRYDLKVVFRDAESREVLGDASRQVTVLNQAAWHAGTVSSNETWAAGVTHIVERNLIVAAGATVTIPPGAILKFVRGGRITVQTGGTLLANGTADARIIFTSISDDSVGGDTNLDGDKSRPQPGEWAGVLLSPDSAFTYNEFVEIRYVSSNHSGALAASQTWLGTFLHRVTGDVVVPVGVTLTIQAGAVVKFDNDKSIIVQNGGQLIADGSLALPVIFTSIKDDSVGGDSNGDGDATVPAPGDWHWILMDSGSAQFNYSQLRYGGGPEAGGWGPPGGPGKACLKTVGNASLTLSNSLMTDAFYDGILAWGGPVRVANSVFTGIDRAVCAHPGSVVTVLNSTFDNNRVGLLIHGGEMIATNVIVAHSGGAGILHDYGPDALTIAYSDLWNPDAVDGDYAGTANQTGKNGNISADPKFKNAAAGNYRLHYGSPCLDAAHGLAAPPTDFMGAPRYTDPRSLHTGVKTALGAYADMGAFEFVETAASDLDLIAYDVTGPAQATAGDLATIRWKVRNVGTAPLNAAWHNAIGLEPDKAAGTVDSVEAAETSTTGALGPNQEASFSAQIRVPGATEGPWRWSVRVNNRGDVFEGVNWTNNLAVATAKVEIKVPALAVGTGPISRQVADGSQYQWFKVPVAAGQDVLVTLNDLSQTATLELYLGQGFAPTLINYDQLQIAHGGQPASVLVSGGSGTTAYLLVHGRSMPGGKATFTIEAKVLDFSLTGIASASRVGNSGPVTFQITGGKLTEGLTYQLTGPDGQKLNAKSVFAPNSSQAFVTFDLAGRALGAYSLSAVQGGHALTLTNAVQVVASQPVPVDIAISSPANIRPFKQGTVVIEYRNNGNVDAMAPLLGLKAAHANFLSPSQKHVVGPNLLLVGINFQGPAGVLPPGAGGKLSVTFTASGGGDPTFEVWAPESPSDSMRWEQIKPFCKPFFLGGEAFDLVWYHFLAQAGSTVGQFNALLADQATRLGRLGVNVVEAQQLMGFALQQADQYGAISQRFVSGAFGQGWLNPLDIVAEADSRQNVFVRMSGLPVRFFRYLNESLYKPVPGDRGFLKKVGDHYELREPNGWLWMFRPDGRLAYVEDRQNRRLTYNYTQSVVTSVSDSLGDQTAFSYQQGRVTQVTDAVGRVTTLTYDGTGNYLSRVTAWDGTSTSFDYNRTPSDAARHALKTIGLPDGAGLNLAYDGQGALQRISRTGAQGPVDLSSGGPGELTLTYPDQGAVRLLWDHFGGLRRIVDSLGRTTQMRFDDDLNLVEVMGANGLRRTMRYDTQGNLLSHANAAGERVELAYDPALNQPTAFRSPRGAVTEFGYDSQANLNQITYPGTPKETYAFAGQAILTQSVNGRGQAIKYTSNAKGLVTRKEFADGSFITYQYDSHRNATNVTQTLGGQARTTVLTYDAADRLTKVLYPSQRWVQYTYDAAGRRTRLQTQDGFVVNYTYDAGGRLAGLTDAQGQTTAAYTYDTLGRLAQVQKGNGALAIYEYDAADQLVRLENRAPNGTVLSRFEYRYDVHGRRTQMITPEGTTDYGYDDAGRLTRVALPAGRVIEYAYDADGNRTAANDNGAASYTVVNEANQVLTSGPASYRYDADGNLVWRQEAGRTSTFEYDSESRLVRALTPEGEWTYEYDAFNQLTAATLNGQRTEYLNDPMGDGSMIGEYAQGVLAASYTHGLGLICVSGSGVGLRYYAFDGAGHTSELFDSAGAVANRYRYLPFGEALSTQESVVNPYKFGGEYGVRDAGAGLLSVRARYYNPKLGRFISRDPGYEDPINPYAFAGNDPVNYCDVTGASEQPVGQGYTTPTTAKLVKATEYASKGLGVAKWYQEKQVGKALVGQLQNSIRFGNVNRNAISTAISQNAHVVRKLEVVGNALEIGVSTYKAFSSIQDYRHGVGSGDQVLHDLGMAAGNILSVYVPVVKPLVSVTDFVSSHSGPAFDWWYGDSYAQLAEMNQRLAKRRAGCRTKLVQSWDPNDITGPAGYGSQSYVMVDQTMHYLIQFENKSNALAAAQMVFVTNVLAPSLDFSTFELGNVGFGTNTIVVPKGRQSYKFRFDAIATTGMYVDISADFDPTNGVVLWTLIGIDPVTLDLPEDPLAGFLPPNFKPPTGEGWMRYSVRPRSTSTNNTVVPAMASIVFDTNPRIDTPAIKNTIDATTPSSAVQPLPAISPAAFTVSWSGQDNSGSGVISYDIYVSTNSGPYALWIGPTTNTSAVFPGKPGLSYSFYSVARDGVGYLEAPPSAADANTLVPVQLSWSLVEGRPVFAWPALAAGYRLESRDSLGSPGAWGSATEQIKVIGEWNTFSPNAGAGIRFYRLARP